MNAALHIYTRSDLRSAGMSRVAIDRALAAGTLIRARRDRYLSADAPDDAVMAVRIGGRLTCVSALAQHGVFVRRNRRLHVHVPRSAGRLRSASDQGRPLAPRRSRLQVLHWLPLREPVAPNLVCVAVLDALIHSVTCQSWRDAVASIDSALHRGFVTLEQLRTAFSGLPRRYRRLLRHVDGRAESGPETLMRLIAMELSRRVEPQVVIDGVARVDLLVDGWLVIECDSRGYHNSWEQQEKDRERDLALARRGYVTIRPTAHHIMNRPDVVRDAVQGLLARGPVATVQAEILR